MEGITLGAVGAALIAGLVSLLGLIIGKEQKVSEFRQAWIDDLRQCLVDYLVNVNAISDALAVKKSGKQIDDSAFLESYKKLNEANHGIVLRINEEEAPAKALLKSMTKFESLATTNADLTPANIRDAEADFLKSSKALLKFEWKRVKRGEGVFVWTKRLVAISVIAMLVLLAYLRIHVAPEPATIESGKATTAQAPHPKAEDVKPPATALPPTTSGKDQH